MMIIKTLAADIECNIREAQDKIGIAYSLRAEYPTEASWYKEMAASHLNFNNKAHDMIANQINNYRNSEEYRQHPEYADGMQAVWNDKHKQLILDTARVKAMIDTFK